MRLPSCSSFSISLRHVVHSLLVFSLALPDVLSLYVVPEPSGCSSVCTSSFDGPNTNGSDIVCFDRDFNDTLVGGDFESCVSCELQNPSHDQTTGQTNLGWAQYNMRYMLAWCIFGFPNNGNATLLDQCTSSCSKLSPLLEINLLTPNTSTTYDYCADPEFLLNVESCVSCYANIPNRLYLSNVLNALGYGCKFQPSPNAPYPVKSSDIFTTQAPSNYSGMENSTASTCNNPIHGANVVIAITIPVVAFLLSSFLIVFLYVKRQNARVRDRKAQYKAKLSSKSTPGGYWSHSPTLPKGRTNHSRNASENSRQIFPAPLNPQKIPVPAPLRTRKSNSPIPFSKAFEQSTTPPVRTLTRTSPVPFSEIFNQPHPTAPILPPAEGPPKQHSNNTDQTFLPATRYSPSPETRKPSLTPHSKRPPGPSSGLISWERIAIQNARIRATQGPSPSPVSPLTQAGQTLPPLSRSPSTRTPTPNQYYRSSPTQPTHQETLSQRPPPPTSSPRSVLEHSIPEEESPPSTSQQHQHLPQQELHSSTTTAINPFPKTITSSLPSSPPAISPLSPSSPPPSQQQHPQSPGLRSDTPHPDDGILVRRSESSGGGGVMRMGSGRSSSGGGGGVMRTGSGRSERTRKEVRWSKDVDYEG